MLQHSSQTTVCAGMKIDKIIAGLKDELINGQVHGESQLITISDLHDDFFVSGYGEGLDNRIAPFFPPIQFNNGDDTHLIIDIRTCTRFDRATQRPVVNNLPLFRREVVRVILESVWGGDEEGANIILNLGHYQISVYATWLAEIFARRFGLDAEQQLRITVIAAYYYLCQFTEDSYIDARRAVTVISRACNINAMFAMQTLEDVTYIANIEDLIKVITETLRSDRLQGLGLQVLLAMLSGSWFGPNNAMLVGMAVEFPPVWNALLYLSLTDGIHRNNGIAKVALRRARDTMARDYIAATSKMIKEELTIDPTVAKGLL